MAMLMSARAGIEAFGDLQREIIRTRRNDYVVALKFGESAPTGGCQSVCAADAVVDSDRNATVRRSFSNGSFSNAN
jgi:hypothetical protein